MIHFLNIFKLVFRTARAGRICFVVLVAAITTSCATKEYLEEGQIELKKVEIVSENPDINTQHLMPYVHQLPGLEGGKRKHIAYDTLKTSLSCRDLASALANNGYLDAKVIAMSHIKPKTLKKRNPQCEVTYFLQPHEPYYIDSISYDIRDVRIDSILNAKHHFTLEGGRRFSVADLNNERNSISALLQNEGYYKFNKDFIRFIADTVPGKKTVDITLQLFPYRANSRAEETEHPCYTIRSIEYHTDKGYARIPLRNSVLAENTMLQEHMPYDAEALQQTYQKYARLNALKYTNIRFNEIIDTIGGRFLDCDIQLSPRKPNSISIQPEGTNTAGDLGAALSVVYENRNLFRGSETFSLQFRGAYEAITGLDGYKNKDYMEYGVESKLEFPRFLFPFISHTFKRSILSTSELSVAYNLQNRPEFHRRMFSAAWKYKWAEPNHHTRYTLDVLDLNYIYMPWISETFKKDYLESESNHNAILRYNYEDLFIMKIGLGLVYNNGINALKVNFETAGNLLSAFSTLSLFGKNDDGQNTLFNIAYAQYVKADIDASHMIKLSPTSELVLHGGLGIAYPYGNSKVLPFEKRYFSGGANSVRGWSVRGLGPGSYSGNDGRIDFINQTGDIKLDLNVEYRTFLFWKFYGAAFIDAGNIWTIRNYESQPGGQFRFNEFYKQLAVAYGVGLRLNFNYFILRFDAGMKAVNPVYNNSKEHYPIFHPDLSRDFAFHFSVGLPF